MGWDIVLNNKSKNQFQSVRWRLLLSYLTVMMAILSGSGIFLYLVLQDSLYRQLDERLQILAGVTSSNFPRFKKENEDEDEEKLAKQSLGDNWDNIDQGIEWLNPHGQVLNQVGKFPGSIPLKEGFSKVNHIRYLTIKIIRYHDGNKELLGYVRVSESTKDINKILANIRWRFGVGGVMVLTLTAIGGLWLTGQSLKPIERSFDKLQQFTQDASHEIRTPLTAIKASVQVMLNHPERIHPADEKKLAAIASASDQLTRLVDDLLLLTRIDRDFDDRSDWVIIELDELLEDLVELLGDKAESQGISLTSNLSPNLYIRGNPLHISRLFTNLISNGLQYTPKGGLVQVTLEEKDRFIWITIQDTGIGIASEQLPYIFDRFFRSDQVRSYHSGLGMGLAIARSITHHHQGQILVTSQLGYGSCFIVKFPKGSANYPSPIR